MATATVDSRVKSVHAVSTGTFTGDGSATTLTLGYVPTRVIALNETDATLWTKMKDMTAANTIKVVTAGTMTVDTGSAILINTDGTVTLSATLGANSKKIVWRAER